MFRSCVPFQLVIAAVLGGEVFKPSIHVTSTGTHTWTGLAYQVDLHTPAQVPMQLDFNFDGVVYNTRYCNDKHHTWFLSYEHREITSKCDPGMDLGGGGLIGLKSKSPWWSEWEGATYCYGIPSISFGKHADVCHRPLKTVEFPCFDGGTQCIVPPDAKCDDNTPANLILVQGSPFVYLPGAGIKRKSVCISGHSFEIIDTIHADDTDEEMSTVSHSLNPHSATDVKKYGNDLDPSMMYVGTAALKGFTAHCKDKGRKCTVGVGAVFDESEDRTEAVLFLIVTILILVAADGYKNRNTKIALAFESVGLIVVTVVFNLFVVFGDFAWHYSYTTRNAIPESILVTMEAYHFYAVWMLVAMHACGLVNAWVTVLSSPHKTREDEHLTHWRFVLYDGLLLSALCILLINTQERRFGPILVFLFGAGLLFLQTRAVFSTEPTRTQNQNPNPSRDRSRDRSQNRSRDKGGFWERKFAGWRAVTTLVAYSVTVTVVITLCAVPFLVAASKPLFPVWGGALLATSIIIRAGLYR